MTKIDRAVKTLEVERHGNKTLTRYGYSETHPQVDERTGCEITAWHYGDKETGTDRPLVTQALASTALFRADPAGRASEQPILTIHADFGEGGTPLSDSQIELCARALCNLVDALKSGNND